MVMCKIIGRCDVVYIDHVIISIDAQRHMWMRIKFKSVILWLSLMDARMSKMEYVEIINFDGHYPLTNKTSKKDKMK